MGWRLRLAVGWSVILWAGCHGSSLIPPAFDAVGDTSPVHDAGKEDARSGLGGGAGGNTRDAGGGAGGNTRDAGGGAGGNTRDAGDGTGGNTRDAGGNARDATGDTAPSADGGDVCPHVVGASDCPSAYAADCRPTWAAVLANPVCTRSVGGFYTSRESRADCDGYHISIVGQLDTSTTYYYDATSDDLVAISENANGRQFCLAGPPSGVKVDCPNVTLMNVCPSDGGSDARR